MSGAVSGSFHQDSILDIELRRTSQCVATGLTSEIEYSTAGVLDLNLIAYVLLFHCVISQAVSMKQSYGESKCWSNA